MTVWMTEYGYSSQETSVGNEPTTPTQPPILSGMANEQQPQCSDAVQLGSKGRHGSFYLWINVWLAGKTA